MGINGLLELVKPITEKVHISRFEGETIAVDAFVWLHRAATSCARQLVLGLDGRHKFLGFCHKRLDMLKHAGVTPILVFDGCALPMKKYTNDKRRGSREEALAKARELDAVGKKDKAEQLYRQAVRITDEMVIAFQNYLRRHDIEFIVAPYEADAQLAHLARTRKVDLVLSEDSDMLVYGCKRTLFKLGDDGSADLINLDRLGSVTAPKSFVGFDLKMFRAMCILSGCDYVASLRGIGIKKAHELICRYKSLEEVLKVLVPDPRYEAKQDYAKTVMLAELTFCHQLVFDMDDQEITHLTPLEDMVVLDEEQLNFIGPPIARELQIPLCGGELDPHTMKQRVLDVSMVKQQHQRNGGRESGQRSLFSMGVRASKRKAEPAGLVEDHDVLAKATPEKPAPPSASAGNNNKRQVRVVSRFFPAAPSHSQAQAQAHPAPRISLPQIGRRNPVSPADVTTTMMALIARNKRKREAQKEISLQQSPLQEEED